MWGKLPSEGDVAWACVQGDAMRATAAGRSGDYRNARLTGAAVLEREGRIKSALEDYLWVCLLDVLDNSIGGVGMGFAPLVIGKVRKLIARLDCNEMEVRDTFLRHADTESRLWHSTVSGPAAWQMMAAELYA